MSTGAALPASKESTSQQQEHWHIIPIWQRMFDPVMRKELQLILHTNGLSARSLGSLEGKPGGFQFKRESFKQMHKVLEAIVSSGKVTVPYTSGLFSSAFVDGDEQVAFRTMKLSTELQYVVTKFWEALTHSDPEQPPQPGTGVTKPVYIWLMVRIMVLFLLGSRDTRMLHDRPFHRLRAIAELDWGYDARRRCALNYPGLCSVLFDLTSMWCHSNGPTGNIHERFQFLSALYAHLFLGPPPADAPGSVRAAVARLAAGEDPLIGTSASKSSDSAMASEQKRRYERILDGLVYKEPEHFNSHNLYPSFPYRRIRYPNGSATGEQRAVDSPVAIDSFGLRQQPSKLVSQLRTKTPSTRKSTTPTLPKTHVLPTSKSHSFSH
eukprot:TRINITY_DN41767_c0_g1_i1.p1 TRINITY_DN41767_c0_g1~~TRINITY_DN41767_c0_g1_i1.p1  ORF type:complete len:380 (+),score=32.16 TRINITY_DN41767_c0_g1_i1:53-1192(+)